MRAPSNPVGAARPSPLSRRTLALVALVVGLAYCALTLVSIRPYGANLSALIAVGDRAGETQPGGLGHRVVIFRHSDGYDGQAYYYVADDPFLQRRRFRDAFRYQRIGYPLAVWAASWGQHSPRPAAMVGVNIIAAMLVGVLSALLIAYYGRGTSVWWALACALSPGLLLGVRFDLTEPLMLALSLGALLLYLRGRIAWSALLFAAALLTREAAILFLLPALAAQMIGRRAARAVVLAASVVPYLAWQVMLTVTLGGSGAAGSRSNFSAPLAGIAAVISAARHASPRNALVHQGSILAVALLTVAALIVAGLQVRRRPDVVVGGMLAHGVAALFGAAGIWIAYTSAARVFGGLFILVILGFARYRTPAFSLLAGGAIVLSCITIINIVFLSPIQPYYLTP